MEFSVEIKMVVDDPMSELSSKTPITLEVFWLGGRWQARCAQPPIQTDMFETMDEALVDAAKEASRALAST